MANRLGLVSGSTKIPAHQFLEWGEVTVGSGVTLVKESSAGINQTYAKFGGTGSGSGGGKYFRHVFDSLPTKIVFRIVCEYHRLLVPGSNGRVVSFRSAGGTTTYYEFNGLTAGQRSLTVRDATSNRVPFSAGGGYDRGCLVTFWGVWKKASSAGADNGYAGLFGHVVNRNVVVQSLDNDDHSLAECWLGYVSSGTNLNGNFSIHEFEMWDDFPHEDLSLIYEHAGVRYFDQCPGVVRFDGAVAGQTPSNFAIGVNGGAPGAQILSRSFGVRTSTAGGADAIQFEHTLVDDVTFNVADDSYNGYFIQGSDDCYKDLPIGQVFWQRTGAGTRQVHVGGTCYMAFNPIVKYGTLTTRTSDTQGEVTLETGHGVTSAATNQTFYWFENGVLKKRRNTTIGVVVGDVVPFSGGTGDVLPLAGVNVYYGYQTSDYRAAPSCFVVSNWIEVTPGSYIFGIPNTVLEEGYADVSVIIGGATHTKRIKVEPFVEVRLRPRFPTGRYFAFGFDDSLLSMQPAWRENFGARYNKPFIAIIVGTSGVSNQLSWEWLKLLRRDGWWGCSHLWNANALGTMVKAIGLKFMDICNQILRCQGFDNTFFIAPQGQKFSSDDADISDEMMTRVLAIRLSATSPVNNYPIDYANFRGESVTNITAAGADPTEEALNWWVARLAAPVVASSNAFCAAQAHEISTTESGSFTSVEHINAYMDVAQQLHIRNVNLKDVLFAGAWPNRRHALEMVMGRRERFFNP